LVPFHFAEFQIAKSLTLTLTPTLALTRFGTRRLGTGEDGETPHYYGWSLVTTLTATLTLTITITFRK